MTGIQSNLLYLICPTQKEKYILDQFLNQFPITTWYLAIEYFSND